MRGGEGLSSGSRKELGASRVGRGEGKSVPGEGLGVGASVKVDRNNKYGGDLEDCDDLTASKPSFSTT